MKHFGLKNFATTGFFGYSTKFFYNEFFLLSKFGATGVHYKLRHITNWNDIVIYNYLKSWTGREDLQRRLSNLRNA